MDRKIGTVVIGHINPDTDAIASAMGYAWLLRQRDGIDAIPARAGHLNPQTTWVFQRLNMEPPRYLPDASPRFAQVAHRYDTATPERPLRDVWAIANRTGGVAPVLNEDGTPYGLLTVVSLFNFLRETIGAHPRSEETRIKDIMDRPCAEACDTGVPRFQETTRIRDMVPRILYEERNEFWVINEDGRYVGVCRQQDALNPPRLDIILVDHNEPGQSLGALEEANLIEILDHHRLGNPTTTTPIRFSVDVVGSTCTLVCERIAEAGFSAPPELAGLLLSGILSDTLILTSPTTTPRDHRAVEKLARWSFVVGAPLAGETIQAFGEQLLQSGAGLASRSAAEIVAADFKLYEEGRLKFGVGQVEVTMLNELAEHREALLQALTRLRDSKGLDFVLLMVTDVVRKSSRLLLTDRLPQFEQLPYPLREDGTLHADGVVSRKKQLLPALLGALGG
jgi:manganese-dependent inorganic pyrophosphatase